MPFPSEIGPAKKRLRCGCRLLDISPSQKARVVKWQTRTFEGRMPQGVRVQVPPRALSSDDCLAGQRPKNKPAWGRARNERRPRVRSQTQIALKGLEQHSESSPRALCRG